MVTATRLDDGRTAASEEARTWWLALVIAALLRFTIMPYGGFPSDIGTFKAWAFALAEHGPWGFYGRGFFADYLPGYPYLLWGIGELHTALRFNDQALLFAIKLPAALADLFTAMVIKSVATRFASPRTALLLATVYLFHPALIFTSAYWGQVDSVGAFLAAGAMALFFRGHPLAWAVAAGAFLVKPQTVPVLVVLAMAMARRTLRPPLRGGQSRPERFAGAMLIGAVTVTALILPFGLGWTGLAGLLRKAATVYPHSSVMAFNLWGALQGFWRSDALRIAGVPAVIWGLTLTILVMAVILDAVWRRADDRTVVLAAAAALVAVFLLPTRIHERYLLPALPFLALATAVDRRAWFPYVGLGILLMLNLVFSYTRPYLETFTLPPWIDRTVFSVVATRAFSAAGLLALLWLLWVLRRRRETA